MDQTLLMLCVFSAGAVVGVLMGGIRLRPAGFERDMASLTEENGRLVEENSRLRSELARIALPDSPNGRSL